LSQLTLIKKIIVTTDILGKLSMVKISKLLNFLKLNDMSEEFLLLKKIAIEVKEEKLREKIQDADSRRKEESLFDYSSLFPDGKEYIVINSESFKDYGISFGEESEDVEMISSEEFSRVSDIYENRYYATTNPNIVKVFGNEFDVDSEITNIALKLYSHFILSEIGRVMMSNSKYIINDFKTLVMQRVKSYSINVPTDMIKAIFAAGSALESPESAVETIRNSIPEDEANHSDEDIFQIISDGKKQIEMFCEKLNFAREKAIELANSKIKMKSKLYVDRDIDFSVVISYDANDMATCSYSSADGDGVSWKSCRNISDSSTYGESSKSAIFKDIVEGGMVAYLVNTDPPYPVTNPLARVRIRHFKPDSDVNNPNDFILKPESVVYSNNSMEFKHSNEKIFLKVVDAWVDNANKKIKNNHFGYVMSGDESSDSLSRSIANLSMFDELGKGKNHYSKDEVRQILEKKEKSEELAPEYIISALSISKDINVKDAEDVFSEVSYKKSKLDLNDATNQKMVKIFVASILKTSAGRNFLFKGSNFGYSKDDFSRLIKSFYPAYRILTSKIFKKESVEDAIDMLNNITLLVLSDINKNFVPIMGLNSYSSEENQIIRNTILSFALEKSSNISKEDDSKELDEKIKDFADIEGYIETISDNKVKRVLGKINNIISEKTEIGYESIFSLAKISILRLLKETDTVFAIADDVKKHSNRGSSFRSHLQGNPDNNVSDSDVSSYIRDAISLDDIKQILFKIEPHIKNKNSDFRKFCMFAVKLMADDFGSVNADSYDDAVRKISKKIKKDDNYIIENFYILSLSEIKKISSETPWFMDPGTNYFFKMKVESGGAIVETLDSIARRRTLRKEQAEVLSKIMGLNPDIYLENYGFGWFVKSP
jgi:hypothetical protein